MTTNDDESGNDDPAEKVRMRELNAMLARGDEQEMREALSPRHVAVRGEIHLMLLEKLEEAAAHEALGEGPVGKRLVELFLLFDIGERLEGIQDALHDVSNGVGNLET